MIAIIDYDMGNIRSVEKAFALVGADARVTRNVKDIADARAVVLPGVGAFGDGMANLTRLGLVEPILAAIRSGKPFLGICVGYQLLMERSTEFGEHTGLGVLAGEVIRFDETAKEGGEPFKVPHMGWNRINFKMQAGVFDGIPDGSFFYFVHSYYVVPTDPAIVATTTDYGVTFASSVVADNIIATQFHPEKSQGLGLKLIENFSKMS